MTMILTPGDLTEMLELHLQEADPQTAARLARMPQEESEAFVRTQVNAALAVQASSPPGSDLERCGGLAELTRQTLLDYPGNPQNRTEDLTLWPPDLPSDPTGP